MAEAARSCNNVRLVIIDSMQTYLGADVDMNRANKVNRFL